MFQKSVSRSWSELIYPRRQHVPLSQNTRPNLKSFSRLQDTLSHFHKQRRVVWRDGDILLQRMIRYTYAIWSQCVWMSYRLFLKISRLAKHYAENATSLQILIGVGIGGLVFMVVLLLIVRLQQNRRTINTLQLREKDAEEDQGFDSDDFDFENDSEEEEERVSSLPPHLRKMLHTSRHNRRSASKDSSSPRSRPSSLVRIVSSDPQSQLSENAIQMDLHARPGHSPVPHFRKRKESGKLMHTLSNEQSSNPSNSSFSSSRLVHTAGRSAKQRRSSSMRNTDHESKRPARLDSLTRQSKSNTNHDDEGSQSPNSLKSFASAQMDIDGTWITSGGEGSNKLLSILRREPQYYASLPQTPLASEKSDQAILDTRSSFGYLYVEPNSEFANSDTFHTLPPTSTLSPGRLPPGAGRGITSPRSGGFAMSPRLGMLSPEQAQALWPEKRQRLVKLREPDWSPYIDVHERARERQDKMAEMNAIRSTSPLLISGSSVSEEGSGSGNGSNTGDEEDEFWFERFTKSTAASGKDWDWRKRRARQRVAAHLATGAGNGTSAATMEFNGIPMQALDGVSDQRVSDLQIHKPGDSAVYLSDPGRTRTQSPNSLPVPLRTASAPLISGIPSDKEGQENGRPAESGSHGRNGQVFPSAYEQGKLIAAGQHWPRFQSSARTVSLGGKADGSPVLSEAPVTKRNRRFSDTDQADAEEAVSVPGRLSSLKPKAVKKMILRGRTSKSDLRASNEEEQQKQNTQFSNGKSTNGIETKTNGYSITPEEPVQPSRDVQKANSMNRLNERFNTASPTLAISSMADQSLGIHFNGQNISPWTEHHQESQQAWSSADAYGASPHASFDQDRDVAGGAGLFSRPSGRIRDSQIENVLTGDLAQLYSNFYAISPTQSPTQQQNSLQQSPGRRRPIRHETMPLLHPPPNQFGFPVHPSQGRPSQEESRV